MRRPLSSPMTGMLTRSRADILAHRSRSGRVRPNSAGLKHLHDNPIHPSSRSVDIKHLREQKRAVSVRCFACIPGKIDHKDTVIKPSDGIMSLIQGDENKEETFCGRLIRKESMQSTSPEVDILRKDKAVEQLKPCGERQHTTDAGSDPLLQSPTKNKHKIDQCSRSKLYQNPGSFGYRRLLPYLSGVEKVSSDKKCSGCEEIIPPSVPSLKVEKEIEEVSMLINSVPLPTLKDDIIELEVTPKLRRSGPGSHAMTPKNNSLKKHTRLCIGVCTCLDCASFRLHADRASEFTRRQLLEADDIVTTLMKQLAYLRKIIEKSSSTQVKELCQNSLKVEQAAKSRMRHLIREMSIHCRLPGPRVKFADPIEEIRILDCGKKDVC